MRRDRWHKEIIDYALSEGDHAGKDTGAGLGPLEFQLGIKTSPGPSNNPGDPAFINLDGVLDDHAWAIRRCGELRQRGVGLCIFAFSDVAKLAPGESVASKSASFWASIRDFDAKLNPPPRTRRAAPGRRGDPAAPESARPGLAQAAALNRCICRGGSRPTRGAQARKIVRHRSWCPKIRRVARPTMSPRVTA